MLCVCVCVCVCVHVMERGDKQLLVLCFVLFYVEWFRDLPKRSPIVRPLVSKMEAREAIWHDGLAVGR